MNTTILTRDGTRVMGISAAMLAATLAALLAVFVLAKPSQAEATTVTVEPTQVGFGAVMVSADPETRTITIRNTGTTALVIGGVDITGTNADDFSLATTIDPLKGLTVRAGDVATLDVNFDPLTEGVKNATLTLNDLLGGTVPGAPQVSLTGAGTTVDPNFQQGAQADCTITGTNNGEVLTGTPGSDIICGLGGNDKIKPLGGKDVTRAGSGKDRVTDKAGKGDKLLGQRGGDRLNARDGNRDLLKGGGGKDRCVKNKGDRVRSC